MLGLLKGEPLHGYEVKNRFEAMLGGTWEVNIGQIYTTLQRLERDSTSCRPKASRRSINGSRSLTPGLSSCTRTYT
ncbi:MAG: hypothetical protein AUI42_02250 [Actinobacteria bacterium 13_1_40CM_2_65_8]|nr:MAG: hypothetical protein AUI42_02250 [Actinobacteria bacterium 13_1_40CM_2_65_8]